jgi:hypothetical protein
VNPTNPLGAHALVRAGDASPAPAAGTSTAERTGARRARSLIAGHLTAVPA